MQICFIGLTSCRLSTPQQGSIAEVQKDETPLAIQQLQRLHSGPIHQLDDVYHNKKLGFSSGPKKKENRWKFRFLTKKNKDSRKTAPHRPLSRETAAVMLQKVIRGFLVRKNWGIVQKTEAEVEAIGEEIARDKMILEKEVKARIRAEEMLMRLLLRLDSVGGVRDYRKKVIRKVISLQELVDSISARGDDKVELDTIGVDRSNVAVDSVEFTVQNSNSPQIEDDKVVEAVDSMEGTPIGVMDLINSSKCAEEGPSSALEENTLVKVFNLMKESPIESIKSIETSQMKMLDEKSNVDQEFTEAKDRTETSQMEILDEKINVNKEFIEAQELDEVCDPTETLEMEESVKKSNDVDQVPGCNNKNNEIEMKRMKDVMERVVVESERMKNLMEELCQSSARQSQLMEGLVNHGQRLEREVAKMKKRDKRRKREM